MVTVVTPSRSLEITMAKAIRLICIVKNCSPQAARELLAAGVVKIADTLIVTRS